MRKTSGTKTIRERLKAAKLMGGRRATNTFLKRFGITATDTDQCFRFVVPGGDFIVLEGPVGTKTIAASCGIAMARIAISDCPPGAKARKA